MIEFRKNINSLLPYDRGHYIEFLLDDCDSLPAWYGISFQLDNGDRHITLKEFTEKYNGWFDHVSSLFDKGSSWIVNHDKIDLDWFPNNENNLPGLRSLFKQNRVPGTFKGGVLFEMEDLLKYSKEIISYPYSIFNDEELFYTNLDISHSQIPFILKVSDHLNIDLLSTEKNFLKEIVGKTTKDGFKMIQYRGTSLFQENSSL